MLVTHGLKNKNHKETPLSKKSINKIDTTSNISNKKSSLNCQKQNKQNENPNIKQAKQYNSKKSNNNNLSKQSPLKKILFIKNLCYKTNKLNKQKLKENNKKIHQESSKLDSSSKKRNQVQKLKESIRNHNSLQRANDYQCNSFGQQKKQRKKCNSSSSQNLLVNNFMQFPRQMDTYGQKSQVLPSSSKKQLKQSRKLKDVENKMITNLNINQFKKERHSLNDIGDVKIQNLLFQKPKSIPHNIANNNQFYHNNNKIKVQKFQVYDSIPQKSQSKQLNKYYSQYWSQERNNQIKTVCCNHPYKEAKFKLDFQEQSRSYYCSKCAVYLVTQGRHIVQNLSQKSNRLQVIKNLLFQIDQLEPTITECLKQTNIIKKSVHEQFLESNKNISNYYQNMLRTIKKYSEQSQIIIKIHYQTFKEEIEKIQKGLLDQYNELCYIRADISPNIEQITNQENLSDISFSQIIHQHQLKLQTIKMKQISAKDNQISYHKLKINQQIKQRKKNELQKCKLEFQKKSVSLISAKQSQFNENHDSHSHIMKYSFGYHSNNQNLKSKYKNEHNKNQNHRDFQIEDQDLIRVSFGNEKNQILSPTFKNI